MTRLICNLFAGPRLAENTATLNANAPRFDSVLVFLSGCDAPRLPNVRIRPVKRPTFRQYLDWASELAGPDDLSIVANADIRIPAEALEEIDKRTTPGVCLALSRWWWARRWDGERVATLGGGNDLWSFRGRIENVDDVDFPPGIEGADYALNARLDAAHYLVRNPAKTIRTWHQHNVGRNTRPLPAPKPRLRVDPSD